MAQSCARLDTRKNVLTMRVVEHWHSLPSEVPQACQPPRGIWTMPSITCFNFWVALKRSGSWTLIFAGSFQLTVLLFSSGVFHWNFTVFYFGSRNTPNLPDSCDNCISFLKGILPLISTSVEFSCSKKDIQPLFERSSLLMDSVLCLFFFLCCHHFLLEIFSCSLAEYFAKPASLLSVLHGWNQSNFEFNKNGVWFLGTLLQEKCQQTGKSPVQQHWGEKELEHLAHKEKPGELDLFSLLRRRTGEEGGLIAAFCHP